MRSYDIGPDMLKGTLLGIITSLLFFIACTKELIHEKKDIKLSDLYYKGQEVTYRVSHFYSKVCSGKATVYDVYNSLYKIELHTPVEEKECPLVMIISADDILEKK